MNEQKNIFNVLLKVIYLIDNKDNYTKQHSLNVCKYALLLGEELKLSEEDLELLEICALLHDVGKIGVPDYLLIKSSKLSMEEFELIKKHVTIGESLFPGKDYEKIKGIIRSHHERIDGKGYPDGLKGSAIPYFSRIISVADTFDAMTTQRSYNKIKTSLEAFEELIRVSSRQIDEKGDNVQQLDPYLVKVFITAVKNNEELLEEFQKRDLDIMNNRNKKIKKL